MVKCVFGPVPSRRLGRSLGINNIPPKTCSYSCVYCQVGKTTHITVDRQAFYKPEELSKAVRRKVDEATVRHERIDYLTFVPDGEPTLDLNLSEEISSLKQTGLPIAVITNASLLWQDDVKEDLQKADFISLKVDAVSEDLWRKINRPPKNLRLNAVLDGIRKFTETFRGTVVSETMLMGEMDYGDELEKIAVFLSELKKLNKAYIAVPTRPPTENWVKRANEDLMNAAFQAFSKKLGASRVECLMGYEGNAFASTGNVEEDLLSITAVHPMREEAVKKLLETADVDWQVVEMLVGENKLVELEYEGNTYYMRKLPLG
ncbi:radical SAM protein [Candidatus Bathyarchaeota archaeon]|nr:radical SAM protein [Candidatus Bathyarchaeota archaeon]